MHVHMLQMCEGVLTHMVTCRGLRLMAGVLSLIGFSTLPFEIGPLVELGTAVLARQDGHRAMGSA